MIFPCFLVSTRDALVRFRERFERSCSKGDDLLFGVGCDGIVSTSGVDTTSRDTSGAGVGVTRRVQR
jgi:hypothetical protein